MQINEIDAVIKVVEEALVKVQSDFHKVDLSWCLPAVLNGV
jgi:hypothetical protein